MKPIIDPDQERKLEQLIQRELGKLPEIPAPASLIPKVMAAIQARAERPWWRRSFAEWPCLIQLSFLVILMAGVGVLTWESATLWGYLNGQALSEEAVRGISLLDACYSALEAVLYALHVTLRGIASQRWAWWALAFLGLVYGSFIGAGTLCYRLVMSNQLQSYYEDNR